MKGFEGHHSEWNLGSPGGWDYQRLTQIIGKATWDRLNSIKDLGVPLDFDHPLLYPVYGFVDMLVAAHMKIAGPNGGVVAVVAEEETLADVTENINLAKHLNAIDGVAGALVAPHELELVNGKVYCEGQPVSVIFMDFNSDVLLNLHRKHTLKAALQAVKEGRVINPRGTEPVNVKSMFEIVTGRYMDKFHKDVVARTPWTRQFSARKTDGPNGEQIDDLIEWTRANWDNLVLKPERGYSGKGVRVGGVNPDADEAIALALENKENGAYIVQHKIPLNLWAEEIPTIEDNEVVLKELQTDFRCLFGPSGLFGFLGRVGGVPTNVGSGGGVQPLAVLKSGNDVGGAVKKINEAIMSIPISDLLEVDEIRKQMALDHKFTYLLGPISIAMRPRIVTLEQLDELKAYCGHLWNDCLMMEKMWLSGDLDDIVIIEPEELEIARMQPWGGSPAILATDGLFGFGAKPTV